MASPSASLTGKVVEEAERELLGQLEEGLKEAVAGLEEAKREVAVSLSRQLEEAKKKAAAARAKKVGSAELTARHVSLQVLQEVVSAVFQEAMAKARSVRNAGGYREALARLLAEAVGMVGGRELIARGNEQDRRLLEQVAERMAKQNGVKVIVDKMPIQCQGGVLVSTPDGGMVYDNTFEARLERLKPLLRKRVAELLLQR